MADVTRLLELTPQLVPPPLAELARIAASRRRRAVALAASATCLAVVGVAVASGVAGGRGAAPAPARPVTSPSASTSASPTPGSTPSASAGTTAAADFPELTAEQIRRHPSATAFKVGPATGAPGVAARIWMACLDECTRATEHLVGERQQALEVTRDDFATGALYRLPLTDPNISHAIDDWYLVDGADRAFLVDSRGSRRPVTRGGSVPVEEVAGPLVHALGGLAYLDLAADELVTVEGQGDWDWWGARDTWFWGSVYLVDGATGDVVRHAVTWRNPDGSFGTRVLPIGTTRMSTVTLRSGVPGTMGVADPGQPALLHVTTDYGATWRVLRIPSDVDPVRSTLPADWATWPEL